MTRPRLVTGARLRYDDVREEHVLLIPEGAVRLNPTAAEVLELCDGERSLDDIVGALSARYEGADLRDDVASWSTRWRREGSWSMPPRPSTLIAELSYQCPLHCPYCSNPLDIGGEHVPPRARDRALDPRVRRGARGSASCSSRSPAASRCCAAISSSCAPARATPACTRR